MSWVKIDDGLPEHEKFASLSDSALALWLKANCWCHKKANQVTCGFIPERKVIEFCGGSKAKAKRLAKELVTARGEAHYGHESGLWVADEGGWRFHDWADYRPESAQTPERQEELSQKRSEAGKLGAAKRWGNRQTDGPPDSKVAIANDSNPDSIPDGNPDGIPDPVTRYQLPKEKSPPPPIAKLDPKLGLGLPRDRPDVQELHEAWKRVTGLTGHSIRTSRGANDASTLAEAIDNHGLQKCLLVVRHAKRDGMVSGRDDDGRKHESIEYIFGNPTTFARIERDAAAAGKSKTGGSMLANILEAEAR